MKKPIPIHEAFVPFGLKNHINQYFNSLPEKQRTKQNYVDICTAFYNKIIQSW